MASCSVWGEVASHLVYELMSSMAPSQPQWQSSGSTGWLVTVALWPVPGCDEIIGRDDSDGFGAAEHSKGTRTGGSE